MNGILERLEAPALSAESRNEARARHAEYLEAKKVGKAMPGDDEARCTMHALSRGQKVIDIAAVMEWAGCSEDAENGICGTPILAIARADQQRVGFRWFDDGSCAFSSRVGRAYDKRVGRTRNRYLFHETASGEVIKLPGYTLWSDLAGGSATYEAIAPRIPPKLRPNAHLSRYHILWEAHWNHAPEDPYLLRRIGKSRLFVVLAQWDLTDTERKLTEAMAPPEVEP